MPTKTSSRGNRIDWAAAQAEYITNGALTLTDIADKYGAQLGAVKQQALRNNWTSERAERSHLLLQKVTEKSVLDGVRELAKYNEQDLQVAKALRTLAARRISQGELNARDIRALAGAVESAQRIARLALGASTENTDTHISEAERMTPEERRERIRILHDQLFPPESIQ